MVVGNLAQRVRFALIENLIAATSYNTAWPPASTPANLLQRYDQQPVVRNEKGKAIENLPK